MNDLVRKVLDKVSEYNISKSVLAKEELNAISESIMNKLVRKC